MADLSLREAGRQGEEKEEDLIRKQWGNEKFWGTQKDRGEKMKGQNEEEEEEEEEENWEDWKSYELIRDCSYLLLLIVA